MYTCTPEHNCQLSFDSKQQYKGETRTSETQSFLVIPTLQNINVQNIIRSLCPNLISATYNLELTKCREQLGCGKHVVVLPPGHCVTEN